MMKLTDLQEKTKQHILEVFKSRKAYLLADEVGLGKTIIAAEVIRELAEKRDPSKKNFVVYYICGNERVTIQNCGKLREICNGIKTSDDRLSMQWENIAKYTKEDGVIILPLTPATTFTNKNSQFNVDEACCQKRLFDKKMIKLTSEDEISYFKHFNEFLNNEEKKKKYIETFKSLRRDIVRIIMTTLLKPDFILLDEFQGYMGLLYGESSDNADSMDNSHSFIDSLDESDHKYPLFLNCLETAEHVLMLSATPYKMDADKVKMMDSFDDGLGIEGSVSLIDSEEDCAQESSYQINTEKCGNAAFEDLAKFIIWLNKDQHCSKDHIISECNKVISNSKCLYNKVLCRSERSMFYDLGSKELEIDYKFADADMAKESLEYSVELYNVYRKAYKETKGLLTNGGLFGNNTDNVDRFIACVKECPAPASFATRYLFLKSQDGDFNYYNSLQEASKKGTFEFAKMFADPDYGIDPFHQINMNLVKNEACPEGIEKILWIPSVMFNPQKDDINNPFVKFSGYTKSLLFGNYRFSTAAPAALFSEYIRNKQNDIQQEWLNCHKIIGQISDASELDDSVWWPQEILTESPRSEEEDQSKDHAESKKTKLYNCRNTLRLMIKHYLFSYRKLISAITKENDVQHAINKYALWGGLEEVIREYAYLIGLTDNESDETDNEKKSTDKNERRYDDLIDMLKNMETYYSVQESTDVGKKLSPTKVIRFKELVDKQITNNIDSDSHLRDACEIVCGFAERFTDDNTDRNAHRKLHQQNLQNLFNAPFYPFIIASTSVAQEGLDFHNYCHRIVHWSVAKTPVAYEQREGRIDRFLSHLMRKRIAICSNSLSNENYDKWFGFEKALKKVKDKQKDIEYDAEKDKRNPKPLFPFWYVGEEEYEKIAGQRIENEKWPKFIRVVCAIPNSRESRYFSKLRAALKEYNYHIGPTYQNEKTQEEYERNLCPLHYADAN